MPRMRHHCVSPVLCWTIPKKRREGVGDRAGCTPERGEGKHGAAAAAERVLRESCSHIPGASRLREQQPRADFTSSSPASLPKAAATGGTQFLPALRYYSAVCRQLATPLPNPPLMAPRLEQPGAPRGRRKVFAVPPELPAPEAGRTQRRGAGRASPGRKHGAQTRSILIPPRVFSGARQSPAVQS